MAINKFLSIILISITFGCVKSITLKTGNMKVPKKSKAYKNINKFQSSILYEIDTNAIYIEQQKHGQISFYGVLKFYSNGYFNLFFIFNDMLINPYTLNPKNFGFRGVYYNKKEDINFDIYYPSNELSWLGKKTGTISVRNDSIILKYDHKEDELIYIKGNLPSDYKHKKISW